MTVLPTSTSTRVPAPVVTRPRTRVRSATELSPLTRYRGGTYSHTVEKIVFSDGSSARTDLIRLNPNLDAYSLDFTGIAPHRPARYRQADWSALPHRCGGEAEVDWILRNSFPMRSTAQVSRQLREAGYPLGESNISESEAIAATQAAIWHFTNGLDLDTRPLNVPVATRRAPGVLTFEFDGEPQLGGYSVRMSGDTPTVLRLQKSADGVRWRDVSGSGLTVSSGSGRRALGVGSTLSASGHGRRGRGYRFYRLIATAEQHTPAIGQVSFWLSGAGHYRNADRVVHLYNYLLAGARRFAGDTAEIGLIDARATVDSELVGPFQVRTPLQLSVTDGHALLDTDGFALNRLIEPGSDFYLRRAPGATTTTLTATIPPDQGGRVLTGVAVAGIPQRLTPVALAVPTDVAIEFDISWAAVAGHGRHRSKGSR